MTSVWPALCPPWKRTTTSARSASQSTIFPFPSSPHWAPITVTLAILQLSVSSRPGLPLAHSIDGSTQVLSRCILARSQRQWLNPARANRPPPTLRLQAVGKRGGAPSGPARGRLRDRGDAKQLRPNTYSP